MSPGRTRSSVFYPVTLNVMLRHPVGTSHVLPQIPNKNRRPARRLCGAPG